MWGQWVGNISGDINGFATLNIDKDSPNIGRILFKSKNSITSFYADAEVRINDTSLLINITKINTYFTPNNQTFRLDEFKLEGTFDNEKLLEGTIDIKGDIIREFKFHKLEEHHDHIDSGKIFAWDDFKKEIFELKRNNPNLIFRGQEDCKFKLETTFHRQNRRDLIRFGLNDITELQKHLTASLNRTFNLSNTGDYSDLLYIAQHHGFPTPLLDWTHSPFVASFFAFHRLPKNIENGNVRIFIFDNDAWLKDLGTRVYSIDEPEPCLSPMTIISMNNSRALPQQSLVTFSNISNIESFIHHKEIENKKSYLTVYDIPYSDRNKAMKDLEIMGITAASLFTGLDGVCSALKEKLFK